jgi:hypothetical protein
MKSGRIASSGFSHKIHLIRAPVGIASSGAHFIYNSKTDSLQQVLPFWTSSDAFPDNPCTTWHR